MSAAASRQTTEKTASYSASNIKKPVLVKSESVSTPKEKTDTNTYTFVGIAG